MASGFGNFHTPLLLIFPYAFYFSFDGILRWLHRGIKGRSAAARQCSRLSSLIAGGCAGGVFIYFLWI
jgi:hypothetical protein